MVYRFETFELNTRTQSLRCAGEVLPLRHKAWRVLVYLLTHRDRMVTKQELSEHIWPNQFVSNSTVESTVAAARRALGDTGRAQRVIQTQYCWGYRFITSVEVDGADADPIFDHAAARAKLPSENSVD